jgi:glutamate-1-semialdehyde aminotransferase
MIARGVFCFPLATKQWSLSAAHTAADVDATLAAIGSALGADPAAPKA